VIEPGEGIGHEATENKSGVAVATSRGRDAGIVARAEPGEASVQGTAAENIQHGGVSSSTPRAMPAPSRRLRLCLKDLYHQDVLEMIERESRAFELWEIVDPDDPDFAAAYGLLWDAFGAHGEMEREDAIRRFLREDPYDPSPDGTFIRYFLIAARDRHGRILGVRDGSVLVNPAYAPDLCVVYLSHLYMRPEARGTVLSYELRIAPVELAVDFLAGLHARGRIALPAPESPGRTFGMRINLTAEMEYYAPNDLVSWQRILFYGRGGFDVVNPRHFPYLQPDFREPDEIRATGNRPLPFMILVRRMGREREATMAIEEASATMRLLYDDFACHCDPALLAASRQRVLDRLAERATRKNFVELLPLPSGARDVHRLRPLFRYAVFQKYYAGASPIVAEYLDDPAHAMMRDPAWLTAEIEKLAQHLDTQHRYVYANRDRDPAWERATARIDDDRR
jgi:hypothetical protein